ncbi:MAG TPA: hypothetical protein VFP98_09210, partial [Candidatus Polarisedimenticolia bacterium]|nr:hypothetical protein [Candidatus Polarisedimenticolia bacterium]
MERQPDQAKPTQQEDFGRILLSPALAVRLAVARDYRRKRLRRKPLPSERRRESRRSGLALQGQGVGLPRS